MAERNPASWLQAGSHPAEHDRLVLSGLVGGGNGVGEGVLGVGDLAVTQNGTPNMSVNVAAGAAFVKNDRATFGGTYHVLNDATVNKTISAADATNPRRDLVVVRIRDAAYTGAVNSWDLFVITGTPAASPSDPAIPTDGSYITLARVAVAAGATSITNANITDLRPIAYLHSGVAVCTSSTRPASPYEGMYAFETDTDKTIVYNGSSWVELVPAGAWTAYTPTITQSGAVAKTVQYAAYSRAGRTISVNFYMTMTGTGLAGNAVTVSLPVTASSAGFGVHGAGVIFDASGPTVYGGTWVGTSTSVVAFQGDWATSNTWGVQPSIALAANDILRGNIVYEAAS
jgi:hypothetical protein